MRASNAIVRNHMAHIDLAPIHSHHHAVQFYGDDAELVGTVGLFLSEGLVAGQPAVVIATEPHREAIISALESRFIDVNQARRLGDLVLLDAEETLAAFMMKGAPIGPLFKKAVGDLIEQTLRGRARTPVRAYGEMVDVLWKQGKKDAAIRVEVLWNELAGTHAFSLLCGYSIGSFYKQTRQFENICKLHTHVHDHAQKIVPFEPKQAAKTA